MKAKDFRQSAWNSLSGKWGTCVLAFLIFELISAGCGALSYIGIGAIVGVIIMGPLTVGISKIGLNVARGKEVDLGMMFNGFNDFARSLVLYITNSILVFLWSLLFVIPGIIKSLSYSMSYYILLDDPKITANEARKKSMEMMDGNKWRLFCLEFSFIGWTLLSLLTFGILSFWVAPYMEVAKAKFYLSLLPEEEQQNSVVNGSDFVDMSRVDLDSNDNFGGDAFSNDDNAQKQDFKEDFDFFNDKDEFN